MTKLVPTICVSGDPSTGNIYLTSGIQPPADEGTQFEQIRSHAEMQSYASGGSIFHMNLTEHMESEQKCTFVKSLFSNFTLRYISLTSLLSVCQECGNKAVGKRTSCSKCGSTDITCWSRPVGYFRPAVRGNLSPDLRQHDHRFWLSSRLEEFFRRKTFDQGVVSDLLRQTNEING